MRIIFQWLGHGEAREGRETNLGGLGDEVFEGEGRLSILMLLLELLGYVNHFDVAVFVKIWGEVAWKFTKSQECGVVCLVG